MVRAIISAATVIAVLPFILSTPAAAHHSHGNYSLLEYTHLQGEVKEVLWLNPHVWIHLEVLDENGAPSMWALEGGGIGALTRRGWSQDDVKPGDFVTVRCHQLRGRSPGMPAGLPHAPGRSREGIRLVLIEGRHAGRKWEVPGRLETIMRVLILLLLSALLPISVQAQWRQYVDQEEYFSVNFPGEPEIGVIDYHSEYGATLPAKVYSVTDGGSLHSVTVVNFTDAQSAYAELADRSDEANNASLWLYDQRASVAYAARNFRLRGGDVTFDAWHHIDLVEGHQMQITNTG